MIRCRIKPFYFAAGCVCVATALGAGCSRRAEQRPALEHLGVSTAALGSFNVLTHSYDNGRTGANTSELYLTQTSFNPFEFGSAFDLSVEDRVYAQVLYASGVQLSTGPTNVVYIAAVNNKVYAYNADNGAWIWTSDLNIGARAPTNGELAPGQGGCGNFSGNVGIVGTPVIDTSGNMYVVAHTWENPALVYRLWKLDIKTGTPVRSAQTITATANGFNLDPGYANQRTALALSPTSDKVYVGFGSYCDKGFGDSVTPARFHGWLLAYDTQTFNQVGVFNSTLAPSPGGGGGIWQSGQGPAVDSSTGNVYIATGNGDWNGGSNLSESVVQLSPTLGVLSYFTPGDWRCLNGELDLDLGVSGPALLPISPKRLVQASKTGKVYLLNYQGNLGGMHNANCGGNDCACGTTEPCINCWNSGVVVDDQIPQSLQAIPPNSGNANCHNGSSPDCHIHSGTILWNGPSGVNLYVWAEPDYSIRSFRYNSSTDKFTTLYTSPALADHGGFMSISSKGAQQGTGILWASNAAGGNAHGALYALNAENLNVLWKSTDNSRDDIPTAAYWNPPTVANGKVYVATFSNIVKVFGTQHAYKLPLHGYHWLVLWSNINLARTNCPPICTKPNMNWIELGLNGTLYSRSFQSGSWLTPFAVTSANFAPPGASIVAAQHTATLGDVFVVGNDGKVYVLSTPNNGPWQAPLALTSANFAPPGAPLATASQGGQLGIAVVDKDGKLEIIWWNSVTGWGGPVAVTAAGYAPAGASLTIGRRASGELDVFSIGSDGGLKYMAYSGGVWSGPWLLTLGNFAPPGAPVAAGVDVHGFLNVFTIANDGALFTKWDCTSAWCGPTALTATGFAPVRGNLSAINFNNRSLNVFLVDKSGTIDALSNAGISWQGPTAIGANLAEPGAVTVAAIEGTSQLDLFVGAPGTATGVVESFNTGGAWSAPVPLP